MQHLILFKLFYFSFVYYGFSFGVLLSDICIHHHRGYMKCVANMKWF